MQIAAFLRVAHSRTKEARDVMAILDAVYQSAYSSGEVHLK